MLDNQKSREFAAKFVDPIAKGLLKAGLTANQVTVLGAISSSAIALLTISNGEFATALLFLIPLVAADLLDGTMARLSNSVSKS
ncbi:MAG: CDP-diacylglycerol--inositol 3-phosphatidyltransferase, partial [Actinomycetota bacterium]